MSIAKRRQKLQKILFMLKNHHLSTVVQAAQKLNCHPSTIEKILQVMRKDGYKITYDKKLKRYYLKED